MKFPLGSQKQDFLVLYLFHDEIFNALELDLLCFAGMPQIKKGSRTHRRI